MSKYLHCIQAGYTVMHPQLTALALPAHAVVVEIFTVKKEKQAELDNGLFLPLAELQLVETDEQWAAITGYEHYQISSHGKIVSTYYSRQPRKRLLKLLNANRYPEITLCNKGTSLRVGLNRLVAQTFLPAPVEEDLKVVIPKDGNRLNLRADNLQWVSLSEVDDKEVWRYLRGYRTRKHKCKLQEADIAEIRALAAQGFTRQAIASRIGVSRPTISVLLSSTTRRLNEL